MADHEMQQVRVYTSETGNICIQQSDFGSDDAIICIHPDQADLLIKWIKEAKDELQNT
jgi:hypothetical protein